VRYRPFHTASSGRALNGNASLVRGTSLRTGGCDIRYAYSAIRSSSVTCVNAVYGKAGYRRWPSREIPSRIARWNALKDHAPMPVSTSGVRLVP
jgi:hypothetical protein